MTFRNAIRPIRRGFTLLELVISVALVLILMLAITRIFSITGNAIGASQGLGAAVRDARAAQAVFARDIGSLASDSPFIWIHYEPLHAAFRNRADQASDHDYDPTLQVTDGGSTATQRTAILTVDQNDNGVDTDTGEKFSKFAVNYRNHRQDRFTFCARDRFYRQTGNTSTNTLVSGVTSNEAWVSYGHLVLPYTNGKFYLTGNKLNPISNSASAKPEPGTGSADRNPQNFFASQWILGRVAMVMVLPTNAPSTNLLTETIVDKGVSQEFIKRGSAWTATSLSPIGDGSRAFDGAGAQITVPDGESPSANVPISVQDARYDLVGIDMSNASKEIEKWTAAFASGTVATEWFANIFGSRFEVNPFAIKPVNATSSSQQVPVFLPACSQFIVEFAGDFVTQDPANGHLDTTADLNGLTPDGQIDFHYNAITGQRQIQWYGMPRSVTNNATIDAGAGDVVPVGDFVRAINVPALPLTATYGSMRAINSDFVSFERFANTRTTNLTYTDASANQDYYVAWGPDSIKNKNIPRPKMYRITLTIDRPELAGRTPDGQTFEYVFNAP